MQGAAPQPSPDPAVRVEGLWKVYGPGADRFDPAAFRGQEKDAILASSGHVVAVQDVSLTVAPGEIYVIMGLSGSGKSTLLRCLLRLIEPSAGRILIGGREVTSLNEAGLLALRREGAAMVFQHYGLLPHRRVIENVAFPLKVRGMSRAERFQRAREAIELVGLKGWEERYPSALSGGMQQRVGIARALATEAPILLLDEPFSGLDPLIRRQLQDELLALQQRVKRTMLFVTHDLQEALKVGDRIAIMRDGSLVQEGTPREVVTNPADDYVRQFVQDASLPVRQGAGEVGGHG